MYVEVQGGILVKYSVAVKWIQIYVVCLFVTKKKEKQTNKENLVKSQCRPHKVTIGMKSLPQIWQPLWTPMIMIWKTVLIIQMAQMKQVSCLQTAHYLHLSSGEKILTSNFIPVTNLWIGTRLSTYFMNILETVPFWFLILSFIHLNST